MDQPWENAEPEGIVPADEFASFLEFNGMNNMQFPELEQPTPHSQQPHHHPVTSAPPSSVSMHQGQYATSMTMEGLSMHGDFQQQQPGPVPYSTPQLTPGFSAQDSSAQHYLSSQPMIPPTPNSIELQGNAPPYSQRMEENTEMYDRYHSRINEEQVRRPREKSFEWIVSWNYILTLCAGSLYPSSLPRHDSTGEPVPSS